MSVERGAHTLAEITSQPAAWHEAVQVFHQSSETLKTFFSSSFNQIIVTGCGSTYYLAQVAAVLFQTLSGVNARAFPASEIALLPSTVFLPGAQPLLITVSRSGETTETLAAVRTFRARTRNPVIAVTCYGDSSLVKQADFTVVLPAAQEKSLAQTRSFASMLIVMQAMAALFAGRDDLNTPDSIGVTAAALLQKYGGLAQQLGEDRRIERFFFLGSGAYYGIACEAMLKMKEMSLSYSEAFHVLEFRHGPMSMVNENSLVVGLLTDEAHEQEAAVLNDMRARGAQILALGEQDYGLPLANLPHFIPIQSNLPPWARPVTCLPVLQLMAYYRSMSNGQNPDLPANLSFVIELDDSMK